MFYIYLDTSFLSQLTKAAREISGVSFNSEKWVNLLTLLRQGVKRGIFLCPASQFQTQEAMLAEDLFKEFTSLQLELCGGCYFKKWEDILVHQVASQALIYFGRPHDIDLGWSVFTGEPPPIADPLATAIAKSNMTQYAELARLLREKFGRRESFKEHYEAEKKDLLQATFLNPYSDLLGMLISEVKIRKEEIPRLFSFLDHKSIDRVPFINVFCSLWASTIVHEPRRKYKRGDLLDIAPLACVIRYCQMITTDTNMKNFIERLHFNDKYGLSVYAPTIKDLEDFGKVLSGLKSK